MKYIQNTFFLVLLLLAAGLCSCTSPAKQDIETSNDYLLRVYDTDDEAIGYGYVNQKRDTIIALGKYSYCFTDTFRTYAIVCMKDSGFVAIDRQEQVMYPVFPFDNGPDEPSDGLFRILVNHKIGYANSETGAIVIKPQFDCAFPFVEGVAQVSTNCQTKVEGEHSVWLSDHWEYIDKMGKKTAAPKPVAE